MREIVFNHAGLRELISQRARVACADDAAVIGALRDGRPHGGFLYTGYLGASIHVHMAGTDEKWCSPDLLALAFHYPFVQLGVAKLIAPVPSTNELALSQDLRCGFVVEAIIQDAIPDGDLFILTMRREQCRFLGRRIRGFTPGVTGST